MDLTPMHKRVMALDVHQAKITACAVVEHDDGRVEVTKRDFGAFKRDRRALAQWALEIRPEVVVMESTGVYWKSPFAALDAGIRINVLVADIHGASSRAMVKALIAGKPMHEVLNCKGRLRASRDELFEALDTNECGTEQFSAVHRFVAEEIMQHIEQIEQRITRLDQYLLEGLQPWQPQLKLLQTLPGIDEQGAAMLLVEIGADMSVFGSAERLASWVGICPGNNESAGKRKTGRIRKGNAWVRRLLCEFAQAAARTRCALKAKFDALAIRKGRKKSVVALAHKMLRTVYAMLANGTHYQDKEIDYEALSVQRNAPRWIKMLRKHGFIASPAAA